MLATQSPYPQYFDLDGSPLDGGAIYFGVADQNPEIAPITVYWDAAGTQPAAQPIRTINGYPSRTGSPAVVYVDGNYSVTVRSRVGVLVTYAPTSVDFSNSAIALEAIDDFIESIADPTGSTLVGYARTDAGAVDRTVFDKLTEIVSVKDFGATGDGATNDRAAIQLALDYAASISSTGLGVAVYFPSGRYLINSGLSVAADNIVLYGDGRFASTIIVNASITAIDFDIGDGSTIFYGGVKSMGMRAPSGANLGSGSFIRSYNATGLVVSDMHMQGWNGGIEMIGAARCFIDKVSMSQAGRTAGQAAFGIRFSGDATAGVSTGNHVTGVEMTSNSSVVAPYLYGIQVTGSDGLYVHQTHMTDGATLLYVAPDNTTNNDLIASLIFSDCYFDACEDTNVWLTGTAATTGTYRDIHFSNCIFRAGDLFLARIGSTSSSSPIRVLMMDSCTFRQARQVGVSFITDNVIGATVSDCWFQDNNLDAVAGGHDVVVRGESVAITDCGFQGGNALGNCVFVASTAERFRLDGLDFTASTRTTKISNGANGNAGFVIRGNRDNANLSIIEETPSVVTTDATVTTLWSYTLAQEEAITLDADVFGMAGTIATGTNVRKIATYYKDGAAAPAAIGATTTVRDVETTAGYFVDIDVSGNEVRVRVTGLAASTVTWGGNIRATLRAA